jgi:hypothetical protein
LLADVFVNKLLHAYQEFGISGHIQLSVGYLVVKFIPFVVEHVLYRLTILITPRSDANSVIACGFKHVECSRAEPEQHGDVIVVGSSECSL